MKYILAGSVIAILLISGVSSAVDDNGKWQEAEACVDQNARIWPEQDKPQRATERVAGCAQNVCKQAQKLAQQTLGHEVSHRCKSAIRVGGGHKGPSC